MKIGELARRSGLSAHTIRYYERIGLLPPPDKNASGHRDYDVSILTWIDFLGRLKATGMPVREMLRYAALREQGAGTEAERQAILEIHREHVRARLAGLRENLSVLDTKIAGYAATVSAGDPAQSKGTKDDDHDIEHSDHRHGAL
ncbi:MAG: MerR family transcriptional regulator [Rhizobiales bacterium]|nr:MerR family transcriptional regulator [Hyphomicrobiales bacterium]MBA70250.1 MerR family transcriptional regulator [Hyphomicrobiales bacterium]|tara:strand:+ start:467 stop:901 length:435 start_codon:yes stop_codon:yes gene_type:complete